MAGKSSPRLFIGTSGWHYDHWRGNFYPPDLNAKEWLSYYARQLNCAEINNTFYHLPQPRAIEQWLEHTPRGFTFAVKAWRVITHRRKLKDCRDAVDLFLRSIAPLKPKLGPILFQLPPRWRCNRERLAAFLEMLPKGRRFTFEFRDHSWHCREVYDLLAQYNAAFCFYDLDGFLSPLEITADFAYIRLHGPGAAYEGKYHGNALRGWQRRIDAMRASGHDVYVFFDNDQAGYAAQNAVRLVQYARG